MVAQQDSPQPIGFRDRLEALSYWMGPIKADSDSTSNPKTETRFAALAEKRAATTTSIGSRADKWRLRDLSLRNSW